MGAAWDLDLDLAVDSDVESSLEAFMEVELDSELDLAQVSCRDLDLDMDSDSWFRTVRSRKRCYIQNVSFYYDKSKIIFKDLNFTIPKGKLVFLIGESGSGKSCIVDILLSS